MLSQSSDSDPSAIPPTLMAPRALVFWSAVLLTGVGAGLGAAILTSLLFLVQHHAWPGGPHLLDAVRQADAWHRVGILLGAGVLTGIGQVVLRKLSSGNSIDLTEAITNFAGRLPPLRTLGSATLSVVVVGMGASGARRRTEAGRSRDRERAVGPMRAVR
jgi:chloride channel protein, CIC family